MVVAGRVVVAVVAGGAISADEAVLTSGAVAAGGAAGAEAVDAGLGDVVAGMLI
jgi:hypothetical protein